MKNTPTKKRKHIVALHPFEAWLNVQFLKDCGLIPYLLYKNHDCDVTFVSAKTENWSYIDTYLKGVKTHILSHGTVDEKLAYISEYATSIDGLILHGPYPTNFNVALLYKKLNTSGKIYLALDANSGWMDRIQCHEPTFRAFMDTCDIIATSSTKMQTHLNKKWSWKIEHIPNGHFNYEGYVGIPSFSHKENLLLTVARIGIYEKANHIMLGAFALIANKIPDWKFYLVGNIDETFLPYIDSYFTHFPHLKDRVIFTGRIDDKIELKNYYLRSKIFCLSSISEGGTPNVIGEALSSGCAIATTKIDAWENAINYGKCGLACDMNDIEGYAKILLNLCLDEDLKHKSAEAFLYSQDEMNMEKIVARLYLMLFGEEENV